MLEMMGPELKPDSMPIKKEVEDSSEFIERRWLFVHELRTLLDQFKSDDWIEVNQVGNINIGRGDDHQHATIDLLWGEVDIWNEVTNE